MAGSHARKRKVTLDDRWREKIKASMILNRLIDHMDGNCEMSTSQVRAAEIVLRKIVPDLSAVGGSDLMPPVQASVVVKFASGD